MNTNPLDPRPSGSSTSAVRLRTRLLVGTALVVAIVAGCASPPADAGSTGGDAEAEAEAPATEATEAPAADVDKSGAAELQEVLIDEVSTDPAVIAIAQEDPSTQGAIDTAYYFLAAWLKGITTGDTSLITDLALPSCQYCAGIPVSIAAEPRTVADGFTTEMTGTLLDVGEPTTDQPYPVVSIGVEVDAIYISSIDEIPMMQVLEPQRINVRIALDQADGGWAVQGIAHDPWPER